MGIRHRPPKGAPSGGGVLDFENFHVLATPRSADPAVAELFETLDTPTCDDLLLDARGQRGIDRAGTER